MTPVSRFIWLHVRHTSPIRSVCLEAKVTIYQALIYESTLLFVRSIFSWSLYTTFMLTGCLDGLVDLGVFFCFLALLAALGLGVFEELASLPFFLL